MATKTIMWGDGTADTLTVTYTGTTGSSSLSVASDPNMTLAVRTITVELRSGGVTLPPSPSHRKPVRGPIRCLTTKVTSKESWQ